MSQKFVVSHLDQQLGPFAEPELKAKWSKGELLPIDYVYDEAKKDWILMAERFEWASGRTEGAPPPLKPVVDKKKTPPAPTAAQTQPQVMTQHKAIESKVVTHTPILNLPAPDLAQTTHTVKTKVAAQAPAPAPAQIQISAPVPAPVNTWTKSNGQSGAKIKIIDGVGVLEMPASQPGQVELVLQDSSNANLKLQEPLKIQVRPIEPEEVMWGFALQQTVGHDLEVLIKAVDAKGNVCTHYQDDFTIHIDGTESRSVPVKMSGGQVIVKIANTKSEMWTLSFQYSGARQLRLPDSKTLEWQPGPAARLILDGPPELVAGSPLKVQVKAVDQYGNLAKTFQGTVILEVKAS